jgi:hypothetical protein
MLAMIRDWDDRLREAGDSVRAHLLEGPIAARRTPPKAARLRPAHGRNR